MVGALRAGLKPAPLGAPPGGMTELDPEGIPPEPRDTVRIP